ncbi:rhoptry neck protein 2, putative [Plasmodium vinckei brucechwatti]|uniref:Rhoptry neck protein 2, putative n=1 Tax=Plasmodium vinckei brucechwatti TaxID=119398 RepID=A0A6V7SME9_PLAVN|nr:rhoptry neck protein 2, putative [Plasmodium vinckei brucechwatti]
MLKATIGIILFICVNIDIIRAEPRENVVNTKFVRQQSPTYNPNKKGDVIFYMPEYNGGMHGASNNNANINLKNNLTYNTNIGRNTVAGAYPTLEYYPGNSTNVNSPYKNNQKQFQSMNYQKQGSFGNKLEHTNKPEYSYNKKNSYSSDGNNNYATANWENRERSDINGGNNNSHGLYGNIYDKINNNVYNNSKYNNSNFNIDKINNNNDKENNKTYKSYLNLYVSDNRISPIGTNGRPGHFISHFSNPNQKHEFSHGFDGSFNQNNLGTNYEGNYGFNGINAKEKGENEKFDNYGNNAGSNNGIRHPQMVNGNNVGSDDTIHPPQTVNGNNVGSDNTMQYPQTVNGNNVGSDDTMQYPQTVNGNNVGSDDTMQHPQMVNGNNVGSDYTIQYPQTVNGNNVGSDDTMQHPQMVNGNNVGSDYTIQYPQTVNGNNVGSDDTMQHPQMVNGNNVGSDDTMQYPQTVNGNNVGSDNTMQYPQTVNGNNVGSDNTMQHPQMVNGNNVGSDNNIKYHQVVNGNNSVARNFTGNDQEIFNNIRSLRPVNHEELYKNKMNPIIYNLHRAQNGNTRSPSYSTSVSDSDLDSDLEYSSDSESNRSNKKVTKYNSENSYGDSSDSDSVLSYESDLSSENQNIKGGSYDIENLFYRDNAQDRETKEKLMDSSESDDEIENPLHIKIPEGNINYHFSNYMNFDKKNILISNDTELLKMIGTEFSIEMRNYCAKKSIFPKKGDYLNVSFEYSKELERIREQAKNRLFKRKTKLITKENNILKQIENSLKREKLSTDNEDIKLAPKSNELKDEKASELTNNYNKLLEEYICHVLSNNPGGSPFEKLYYHNLAIGEIMKPIKTKYNNEATASVALNYEVYILSSSNIYLFGHMLLLSLAYLSYNSYFTKGTKSFYSMETLLLANSDYSFFMFNEMCNVYYKPNKSFKKDLTFIPIELRPGRYTTYVGERRIICDTLELILNAVSLININEIYNVFYKNNVNGYENSVSFSNNAIRVFSQVCPRHGDKNAISCSFENSTLYKKNVSENDINEIENQKELKKAFDLLNTFSEIENTSNNNNYQHGHYIKLIMEQNLYTDFYKYLFWYDNRELIKTPKPGKKITKKSEISKYIYNQYMEMHKLLETKFNIPPLYNLKKKAIIAFYSLIDKYSDYIKNKKMRNLYLKFVSYTRHFLFMNSAPSPTSKSNFDFMKMMLDELQSETNVPLKLIVRGNYFKMMEDLAKKDSLFYINLFILSSLSNKNPVKSYYNGKRELLKVSLSEKFATSTSAFIPHKLRRIVIGMKKGILKKNLLKTLMKNRLLQHIPINLLENITTTFRFTTHSFATTILAQNAHRGLTRLNHSNKSPSEFVKSVFSKGGFPQYADKLMGEWFSKGFEEYKNEKIANQNMENEIDNELDKLKGTNTPDSKDNINLLNEKNKNDNTLGQKRIDKLIYNEHDKWDHYINKEYVKALSAWIDMNKEEGFVSPNIFQAIQDSKYLLENNIEDNIFFSRTPKPTKQSGFRNVLNKTLSLGKMLLRKPSFKVDHAVWFGATINMNKGFALLKKVSELHKLIRHEDESWLINEAFIEIVDHIISMRTPSNISFQAGYLRNPAMPLINPFYHELPHEERLKELQHYMCYDHCSSLWKMLSTFALHHLKNPDSLQTYEEKFSKNSLGNQMTDKDFVNNFKMILGGDAALHFYDNLLPKSMKKELKSMKYGVSLSFSFSLKVAKMVFGEMQLPHLSHMFYAQAPYFGHFIGKWQKERQEGRLKEIFAAMTLGTLSTYTMLSAMDITQHAKDIGMGPSTSCYTSLVPPPKSICIQQAVKSVLTNSTLASMKSVFSVGLFAAITPYLFAPMAGLALWSVLKSQFKVVNRIDMALKGAFKNMWNKFMSLKGIRRLKTVFKKLKIIKKKMIQKTEQNLAEIQQNPEAEQNHKAAVEEIHNTTKGNYHYISYAKIVV